MTLAQNPLLPLSGNKYISLPIIILLSICLRINAQAKDISTTRDTFHIALILPFNLNTVELDSGKIANVYAKSKLGVEYYKGVLLALDSLKGKGLKMVMTVIDCPKEDDSIKKIISNGALDKIDIIIGPVFNSQARLVADFVKKKHILMVSPLSPAENITAQNPDFVMVNPRLETHCLAIAAYVADSFINTNMVLLHQTTTEESKFASLIEKSEPIRKLNGKVKLNKLALKNKGIDADVKPLLKKDDANLAIIPSTDLPFLVNICKNLNKLANEGYDITVIGLPIWGTDENIRMDYVKTLKAHFTSSYYLPPTFYDKNAGLCKAFIDRYGNQPSENAIKAYDLISYLGNLLIKHPSDYQTKILSERMACNHTQFNFKAVKSLDATTGKESIDFIENSFVNIVSYQNNKLILVTPR